MNLLLSLSTALLCFGATAAAQSNNTAITSGSIGKCAVWGHPYTLYNTVAASQTVSNGVTVTVDQNRNIGAVNLAGTGAMNLSGANGITLSGTGGEINCRWNIYRTDSHSLLNNDEQSTFTHYQDWGNFMTVPYTGTYRWQRTTGWAASLPSSSSYYGGSVMLVINNDFTNSAHRKTIFLVDQDNICSTGGTQIPSTWYDNYTLSLSSGQLLGYGAQTNYTNFTGCNQSRLNATCGNAVLYFDN